MPTRLSLLLVFAASTPLSCSDALFASSPAERDADAARLTLPPLANAGADREVLRGDKTSLDARGTWHPTAKSFTVTWEQVAGESVYLSNANAVTPTFIAPLTEQALSFELTVSDGDWQVRDVVTLLVRNEPALVAPVLSAGPDYVSTDGDEDPASRILAGQSDVGEMLPSAEEIWPAPASSMRQAAAYAGPRVYRVDTTRSGLASAPDYVLVHALADATHGEQAPTGAIDGPSEVAPGAIFELDARGSADVNNDELWYFWEQTRGEPALVTVAADDPRHARVTVLAPSRRQELAFRVHAWDGALASAPAEASVRVSASGDAPAALAPGVDLRARPAGEVTLVARLASNLELATAQTYAWEQTRGEQVSLAPVDGGRAVTFVAPRVLGELGFVVRAQDGEVSGEPVAYRVEVVGEETNSAPHLFMCASTLSPALGQRVLVTVRAADPEGDALVLEALTQAPSGAVALSELEMGGGTTSDTCGISAAESRSGTPVLRYYEFLAPASDATLRLSTRACDGRDACGETAVDILLP